MNRIRWACACAFHHPFSFHCCIVERSTRTIIKWPWKMLSFLFHKLPFSRRIGCARISRFSTLNRRTNNSNSSERSMVAISTAWTLIEDVRIYEMLSHLKTNWLKNIQMLLCFRVMWRIEFFPCFGTNCEMRVLVDTTRHATKLDQIVFLFQTWDVSVRKFE